MWKECLNAWTHLKSYLLSLTYPCCILRLKRLSSLLKILFHKNRPFSFWEELCLVTVFYFQWCKMQGMYQHYSEHWIFFIFGGHLNICIGKHWQVTGAQHFSWMSSPMLKKVIKTINQYNRYSVVSATDAINFCKLHKGKNQVPTQYMKRQLKQISILLLVHVEITNTSTEMLLLGNAFVLLAIEHQPSYLWFQYSLWPVAYSSVCSFLWVFSSLLASFLAKDNLCFILPSVTWTSQFHSLTICHCFQHISSHLASPFSNPYQNVFVYPEKDKTDKKGSMRNVTVSPYHLVFNCVLTVSKCTMLINE